MNGARCPSIPVHRYLYTPRAHTAVPEPPMDLKLLPVEVDTGKYARYASTPAEEVLHERETLQGGTVDWEAERPGSWLVALAALVDDAGHAAVWQRHRRRLSAEARELLHGYGNLEEVVAVGDGELEPTAERASLGRSSVAAPWMRRTQYDEFAPHPTFTTSAARAATTTAASRTGEEVAVDEDDEAEGGTMPGAAIDVGQEFTAAQELDAQLSELVHPQWQRDGTATPPRAVQSIPLLPDVSAGERGYLLARWPQPPDWPPSARVLAQADDNESEAPANLTMYVASADTEDMDEADRTPFTLHHQSVVAEPERHGAQPADAASAYVLCFSADGAARIAPLHRRLRLQRP
ncbi:hypothetical protein CDCA_CDCA15G3964 [Cyanidium caldarium]|uniref:Uncharacterized protein n=1 Tax=Cyanidium caldarium TaxID=2771 RepID=A0AAV9J059_CYACA|nr:hypothetical protein CDCA_CDCA15G3964 [Cyanidium caldarium]